jgi:hypothetical protein
VKYSQGEADFIIFHCFSDILIGELRFRFRLRFLVYQVHRTTYGQSWTTVGLNKELIKTRVKM